LDWDDLDQYFDIARLAWWIRSFIFRFFVCLLPCQRLLDTYGLTRDFGFILKAKKKPWSEGKKGEEEKRVKIRFYVNK
jgi:hypothetical protein